MLLNSIPFTIAPDLLFLIATYKDCFVNLYIDDFINICLNKTVDGENINAHYNRYFIQPGIGVKQDFFEASFCTRIAYVDVYDLKSNNPNLRPTSSIFVEPVLTGRFGYKYVKFFTQFGLSMHTIDVLSLYSLPVILNFGMNLSFSELYKKKEKTPGQ